ncbi:MAG: glycine cleavage T C-terminal barrel domain-containing protein, partial [Pseudomonadota bacterium]
HWKSDILTEFDPFETGLGRFVKLDKGDFVGKSALIKRQAAGPARQLVTLRVEASHAPAIGGASLMHANQVVGTVTSGDWGHRTGLNLAYAFVAPELAQPGTLLQLDLCGDLVPAQVIPPAPYDPTGDRMRS